MENPNKKQKTDNVNVVLYRPLISPAFVKEQVKATDFVSSLVAAKREEISSAVQMDSGSDRLVCVVGPCSIHSKDSAIEYAQKLKALAAKYTDTLIIVMRVYFEKPRTTVGWKGLINDPNLDGSFQINDGLKLAREILMNVNAMGLPCGVEFLDSISPQFLSDLVAWGAIGARTTESQIHRELASGMSCPIGFKNGTAGSTQMAIDAVLSASQPHNFLGVTDQGLAAIVNTSGNKDCHVILRGGAKGPNFYAKDVNALESALRGMFEKLKKTAEVGVEKGNPLPHEPKLNGIIVDCSHGNSFKDHNKQIDVVVDVAKQISSGCKAIKGVMIESNIKAGNQKLDVGVTDPASLEYGKSVTDACVDLEVTAKMLDILHDSVLKRRELSHN